MQQRQLTKNLQVSALGLGCMGMSEFYRPRDDAASLRVLAQAVDNGINFFDTADMYGPYHNEEIIGRFLAAQKQQINIATKFGIVRQPGEYRRRIDNSAAWARHSCEASLRRLGVEQIDLYYVHRLDTATPVEETMATLAQGEEIIPIPGTCNPLHLQENIAALTIKLTSHELTTLREAVTALPVMGECYTLEGMKGLDA